MKLRIAIAAAIAAASLVGAPAIAKDHGNGKGKGHDKQEEKAEQKAERQEVREGAYFNQQHRETAAYQWIETASHSYTGLGGIHVLNAGFDLLHGSYDGTSDSQPVLIERSDGTLARRLDYDGPSIERTTIVVPPPLPASSTTKQYVPDARSSLHCWNRSLHAAVAKSIGSKRIRAACPSSVEHAGAVSIEAPEA